MYVILSVALLVKKQNLLKMNTTSANCSTGFLPGVLPTELMTHCQGRPFWLKHADGFFQKKKRSLLNYSTEQVLMSQQFGTPDNECSF